MKRFYILLLSCFLATPLYGVKKLYDQLCEAAKEGSFQKVKFLVEEKSVPPYQNNYNFKNPFFNALRCSCVPNTTSGCDHNKIALFLLAKDKSVVKKHIKSGVWAAHRMAMKATRDKNPDKSPTAEKLTRRILSVTPLSKVLKKDTTNWYKKHIIYLKKNLKPRADVLGLILESRSKEDTLPRLPAEIAYAIGHLAVDLDPSDPDIAEQKS